MFMLIFTEIWMLTSLWPFLTPTHLYLATVPIRKIDDFNQRLVKVSLNENTSQIQSRTFVHLRVKLDETSNRFRKGFQTHLREDVAGHRLQIHPEGHCRQVREGCRSLWWPLVEDQQYIRNVSIVPFNHPVAQRLILDSEYNSVLCNEPNVNLTFQAWQSPDPIDHCVDRANVRSVTDEIPNRESSPKGIWVFEDLHGYTPSNILEILQCLQLHLQESSAWLYKYVNYFSENSHKKLSKQNIQQIFLIWNYIAAMLRKSTSLVMWL